MIHKFKFYLNDIESEIFEYDEKDYDSYNELILQVDEDRLKWVFEIIESGYIKVNGDE